MAKEHLPLSRRQRAQNESAGGGLTGARLPDQAKRFAFVQREAHTVDGLHLADHVPHYPALNWEILLQVADLEQDLAAAAAVGPRRCHFGYWYRVHRTQWFGRTSVIGTGSGPWQVAFFGARQRG